MEKEGIYQNDSIKIQRIELKEGLANFATFIDISKDYIK